MSIGRNERVKVRKINQHGEAVARGRQTPSGGERLPERTNSAEQFIGGLYLVVVEDLTGWQVAKPKRRNYVG